MVPENGRYIRRSLDLIAESLLDTLHSGPGSDAKSQAAKCLGRVGYVLEQDFKRLVVCTPYCGIASSSGVIKIYEWNSSFSEVTYPPVVLILLFHKVRIQQM
jgi:hypothetical protein